MYTHEWGPKSDLASLSSSSQHLLNGCKVATNHQGWLSGPSVPLSRLQLNHHSDTTIKTNINLDPPMGQTCFKPSAKRYIPATGVFFFILLHPGLQSLSACIRSPWIAGPLVHTGDKCNLSSIHNNEVRAERKQGCKDEVGAACAQILRYSEE